MYMLDSRFLEELYVNTVERMYMSATWPERLIFVPYDLILINSDELFLNALFSSFFL